MADKKQLHIKSVVAQVRTTSGAVRHLTRGDVVPDDVTDESLALLKELGYVAEDGGLTHDEMAGHVDEESSDSKPAKKSASSDK